MFPIFALFLGSRFRRDCKEFLWEDASRLTAAQVLLQVRELVGSSGAVRSPASGVHVEERDSISREDTEEVQEKEAEKTSEEERTLLDRSLRSAHTAEEAIVWAQYAEGLLSALLRLLEENEVFLHPPQQEAVSEGRELLRAVRAPSAPRLSATSSSSSAVSGAEHGNRSPRGLCLLVFGWCVSLLFSLLCL
jgi:hypothetical protein